MTDASELYAVIDGTACRVLRGREGDNVFEVEEPIAGAEGAPASSRRRLVSLERIEAFVDGPPAASGHDTQAAGGDGAVRTPGDADAAAPATTGTATTPFSVHYPAGLIPNFTRRAWSFALVALAAGVAFFLVALLILDGFLLAAAAIIAVLPAIGYVRTAIETPGYWAIDDGLAVAFDDDGVTVPSVGLVAWDRITRIELHPGPSMVATGPRLRIFFRGDAAATRRLRPSARVTAVSTRADGVIAHDVAFSAALEIEPFADAVAAVSDAAAERGIPVA